MKPIDPVKARQDLEEILSYDEYQIYYQQKQNTSNFIKEIFKNLFPEFNISDSTIEWISGGIIIFGLLCLFLLFLFFWTKLSHEGMFKSNSLKTKQELGISSDICITEADILAKKGAYKEAFRNIFLAFIISLDQNEWIEARTWKTNWEYYNEIKNLEIASYFYKSAIQFEEVMYGGKEINMEEYLTYRNQVTRWINIDTLRKSDKLVDMAKEN